VAIPVRFGLPSGRESGNPPPAPPGGIQEEIRRQNLGAVLRYVHLHGPTSRAELTGRLGLNRSTIGALAADLAAAGLVTEETATPAGRAGRPSLVVSPRSGRVFVYALSLEADRLRAARVGLGGRILDLRETRRPPGMPALDAVEPLAALVRELRDAACAAPAGETRGGSGDAVCVGGGIAVADTTRGGDGTIRLHRADAGLAAALGAEVGAAPVGAARGFVTGDLADITGLAEQVRGVAAGVGDVLYLHGDLGISAGIITGGRLIGGHGGHSGKVGHMVVNPGGLACWCGSRGCWETEAGRAALLRHATLDQNGTVLEVLRAAAGGDPTAAAAVHRVGDWLGFGVANLVNVINPDLVVFGGTLRELYTAAAGTIRQRVDAMALPASRENVQLRAAALGDTAALIGAAELAFDQLLADPLQASLGG
jgi:predicted NBD/HSP70 family sugar kinase